MFLYSNIVVLISARLWYVFFHFDDFRTNILKYILVRETPGLSLLGGLVVGFIFLFFYVKRKKLNFLHILDIFSVATSFALVFAKIGEQLGGAGFGKETNFIIGVNIAGQMGRRHPAEFYEALIFLLLSIILTIIYDKIQKNKWPEGVAFYIFSFGFCLTVFLIEFLTVHSVYLYGLSIRQIIALLVIILTCVPLIKSLQFNKILKREKV